MSNVVKLFCTALIFIFNALFAVQAYAAAVGQFDDFEDDTTQGWQEGGTSPNPPTNVSTGGPGGTGDNYLENVSSGSSGSGGKLVQFNQAQWQGDYVAAGIRGFFARVKVFSGPALSLRVGFRAADEVGRLGWVSKIAVPVPADGAWHDVYFPIAESDLQNDGSARTYAQTMSNVGHFRILHSTTAVFNGPDLIAATAGFDDIQAVGTLFQGWLWETGLWYAVAAPLNEEYCFGRLDLEIAGDDTWLGVSSDEVCWGRETANTNPARSFVNYDPGTDTFPVTESYAEISTQPLVRAGGNLFELFGEELGGGAGEERLGTVLAEPSGRDLLIVGGADSFDDAFSAAGFAYVDLLVTSSLDFKAARVRSDVEGLWRISFINRALSRVNVNTESVLAGINTLDLQGGGVCLFQESSVFQESEFDTNNEIFVASQFDMDGVDLANRGVQSGLTNRTASDCTYSLNTDKHLSVSFTRTTAGGPTPVILQWVVSDDNNYLVWATDPDGVAENPSSLNVGYRAPSAMTAEDIDGSYLFLLSLTDFDATGTGHTLTQTGDQEHDLQGRGLISFDSLTPGTIPAGQVGNWFACDVPLVVSEASVQVEGEPGIGTVTSTLQLGSVAVAFTSCDYNVSADGGLLVNLTMDNPGEPTEEILFAGYVNNNGELLSLVDFLSEPDPFNPVLREDSGSVRHILAMKYTGNPDGNEDSDEFTNLEEFQLPLPPPPTQFECSSGALPIVCAIPDVTSDDISDIAVMRNGSIIVEVRDGSNSLLQRDIEFFTDFAATPVAAATLPDSDGNGVPELAVLATRDSDGRIVAEIRNLAGAQAPRLIWFAEDHTPLTIKVIDDDADNNGLAELAVLSTRDSDGRIAVEVKNAFGPTKPNTVWFMDGNTPVDLEVVSDKDANGVPEVAVLSFRNSDGRSVTEVKNAAGPTAPTTVWFMEDTTAIDLVAVDDKEPNGIPEVAVLSSRISDGRNLVEIKNASGPTAPTTVWFMDGNTATDVAHIHDADGNGVTEVAVLSVRDSDGRIVIEVKNVTGPTSPNTMWYSSDFTARGMVKIDDTDSNGIEEALVLMIRDSDGRILVQGRNAEGDPAPIQYWFSP